MLDACKMSSDPENIFLIVMQLSKKSHVIIIELSLLFLLKHFLFYSIAEEVILLLSYATKVIDNVPCGYRYS